MSAVVNLDVDSQTMLDRVSLEVRKLGRRANQRWRLEVRTMKGGRHAVRMVRVLGDGHIAELAVEMMLTDFVLVLDALVNVMVHIVPKSVAA